MQIRKFTHVDNGKTLYAVIGEPDADAAMIEVCRYKKDYCQDKPCNGLQLVVDIV